MVTAQAETDNADIIEELLRTGRDAPEPGGFMQERVIHKGDEEVPTPILASSLASAGYVEVYDTHTGEASIVNRNLLEFQLRKLHPDGSRAFTRRKPAHPPTRGTLKCLLHSDGPNRQEYDSIGFRTCPKANLMTPFDVDSHMKARHKREWAVIEANRIRREREDDRAFQRQTMKTMSAAVIRAPKSAKK